MFETLCQNINDAVYLLSSNVAAVYLLMRYYYYHVSIFTNVS